MHKSCAELVGVLVYSVRIRQSPVSTHALHLPPLRGSCGRTIANTTRQLTAVVESKLALGHPDEDSVWDVVVDSVEPVETLKTTLRLWSQRLPARAEIQAIAADISLMLHPQLVCDTFCH